MDEAGIGERAEVLDAEDLDSARQALSSTGRLLLSGTPGTGKSTILQALIGEAGPQVVHVRAAKPDVRLTFSLVAEILSDLPKHCLTGLPDAQRAAVDAVLRRGRAADASVDTMALRFALAEALRIWAREPAALLAIDDAHWSDPGSAEVLAYALSRAPGRLACVVAECRSRGTVTWPPDDSWQEVEVRPLSGTGVAALLSVHQLPCRLAGQVHRVSGGLPRWALEVARSLARGEQEDVPRSVRADIVGRLGELPSGTRDTLLLAAIARHPTTALLRRAGRPAADEDLRPALAQGLVSVDALERIVFSGTAIVDTLAGEATWSQRSAAHRVLAGAVDDQAERALHRALAVDDMDQDLAAELSDEAARARARGDRVVAAELGLLTAARAATGGAVADAIADAAAAGRADLVRRAEALLGTVGPPAERARARLSLLRAAGQSLDGQAETFARALADADDDPRLQAGVRLQLAIRANVSDGDPGRARDEAARACELAALAGDRELLASALTMRARTERIIGAPTAEATLAEALAACSAVSATLNDSAPFLAARHAAFDDRPSDARMLLLNLLPIAERRADPEDIVDLLRNLAEVEVRTGRCELALTYARRSAALTESAMLSPGPAWYTAALAEAAGGCPQRALTYARHGARASEDEHDLLYLARNLHALGVILLAVGDPEGGERALARVRALEGASGVVDPSMLRWHGDLAIALVATGRDPEAANLIAEVRPTAERLGRFSVLAALDHAEGRLLAARGDLAGAEQALTASAAAFEARGLPLERGRVLLTHAHIARRRRHKAHARQLLAVAGSLFATAEARPWLAMTHEAAARLDVVRATATGRGALTGSEARVAELVVQGATNKEIAAALFLSVKTVEATLTRVYRKTGVRSRTRLATVLGEAQ